MEETAANPTPDVEVDEPSAVLATVNGMPITEEAFRYWWQKQTPGENDLGARRKVLDDLIERMTMVQHANALGLQEDHYVQENLHNAMIARLREERLRPRIEAVQVSDQEARDFYEANMLERFTAPAQVQLAVLWWDTRGVEELEKRATERLTRVRRDLQEAETTHPVDDGFGQMSPRNSQHQASRYKGGVIGWLAVGGQYDEWRSEALRLAGALAKPGDVSQVACTPRGTFLVRLVARRPEQVRSLEDVKASIVQQLKRSRVAALEANFREELRRQAEVVEHSATLEAMTGLPTQDTGQVVARQKLGPQVFSRHE